MMVIVRFLKDGKLSNGYRYKKDEFLIVWEEWADELKILDRAEIIETCIKN